MYDPFHPTGGDKEIKMEVEQDEGEKYDPFDPTGSPASEIDDEADVPSGMKKEPERRDEEEDPPDSTDTLNDLPNPCLVTQLPLVRRVGCRSTKSREKRDSADSDHSEIEEGEIVGAADRDANIKRTAAESLTLGSPTVSFFGSKPERILRVLDGDGFVSVCAEGSWDVNQDDDEPVVGVEDLRRKLVSKRKERYLSFPASSSLSPQQPPPPTHPPASTTSSPLRPTVEKDVQDHKSKGSKERDKQKGKDKKAGEREERRKKRKKEKEGGHEKRIEKEKGHTTEKQDKQRSRSSSQKRKKRRHSSPDVSRTLNSSVRGTHTRRSFSSLSEEQHRDKDRERGREKEREKEREREREREREQSHGHKRDDRDRASSSKKERERKEKHHSSSRERHISKRSKRSKEKRECDRDRHHDRDWRRDGRPVVPPSIQDLNGSDLFAIKRTITVTTTTTTTTVPGSPRLAPNSPCRPSQDSDKPYKRKKKRKWHSEENRRKVSQAESHSSSNRTKNKCLSSLMVTSEPSSVSSGLSSVKRAKKVGKDKVPDKTSRKDPSRSNKTKKEGGSGRKGKLQSKVSVLVREGVSSTTGASVGSGKLGMDLLGSGVVFCRDNESRSPFLKPCSEPLSLTGRGKDLSTLKSKKTKPSSITSTSSSASSPSSSLATKRRRRLAKKTRQKAGASGLPVVDGSQTTVMSESWGGASLDVKSSVGDGSKVVSPHICPAVTAPCSSSSSSSSTSVLPPSSSPPHTPPPSVPPSRDTRDSSPDSQTVDSSCKTPEPCFPSEDCPSQTSPTLPMSNPSSSSVSSSSVLKPPLPPPPAAPVLPWSLQTGVDCTTGGVLALTALLFKMEEANITNRAKAQEFIQATNQSQSLEPPPSAASSSSQIPAPSLPPPPPPPPGLSPTQFILHSSLPLVGCTKTPPSHLHPSIGGGCYLKKLHTQERAVEEVKLAIKPYYQRKDINKDEYKDILRKAVHKICHSRTGEINPVKVSNLVKLYVQRYKYFRKHGRKMDDEERNDREMGALPPSRGGGCRATCQ
uniref:SR-related CTD-associated factor 1 n=1 Tax=Cynoglossus semilaevis TaxID=244447 RepID=A0A3P8VZC6_CYNSE